MEPRRASTYSLAETLSATQGRWQPLHEKRLPLPNERARGKVHFEFRTILFFFYCGRRKIWPAYFVTRNTFPIEKFLLSASEFEVLLN